MFQEGAREKTRSIIKQYQLNSGEGLCADDSSPIWVKERALENSEGLFMASS